MYTNISTSYNLLKSTIRIENLIPLLKAEKIDCVAITGETMNGYLTIIRELTAHGIRALYGLKLCINGNNITAYGINKKGYHSLVKLSSLASLKQLSFESLLANQAGVTFVVPIDSKFEWIQNAKQLSSLCIGVERINGQRHPNESHLSTWQLPVIIQHDMHNLTPADAFAYKVLRAIDLGEPLRNYDVPQSTNHILPLAQLQSMYSDQPQWIQNTVKFLNSGVAFIPENQPKMPTFPIPTSENNETYFRRIAHEKLQTKGIISSEMPKYLERLNYELNVICEMNYEDYFLIVADFMEFARREGILTGPGRGSSASSLVAYVLGITQVDPLLYDLLFERFLNPARISLPDIDIDFIDSRREEVIRYVAEKYGNDRVVQINTFGTLSAKAVARDVGRMLNFPTQKLNTVSKMIAASKKDTLREVFAKSKDFQAFVKSEQLHHVWYDTCLRLEGLQRNESTHAAGVILAPMPLVEFAPISRNNDGLYCTQWTMTELESIGLLKMDFLGLRNLGLLESIVQSVEKTYNTTLPLEKMPLNNAATYRLLQKGLTEGVFQLESPGMKETLQQVMPSSFEDIIAINALYRPGPMAFIPTYAERKKGASYEIMDVLKPILGETYNIIIYQEQILKIAQVLAGFSLAEADLLRRAISKKNREVLKEQEQLFVAGAIKQGHSEQIAKEVYELILKFAEYGFPKSHSTAYSVITYQLAYLKANYPAHFYASLINQVAGNPDKVKKLIDEVNNRQIPIVYPTYPTATYECRAENRQLHLGYNIIKNIIKPHLEALMQLPVQTDLFEMGKALGDKMDKVMFSNMIAAGVFDKAFNKSRRTILSSLESALAQSTMGLDLGFIEVGYQDNENLDMLEAEKTALGFYLSENPLVTIRQQFKPTATVATLQENNTVTLVGNVDSIRETMTKRNQKMAFVTLSDENGKVSVTLFANVYEPVAANLKKGAIAMVDGNVESYQGKLQIKANKLTVC